MPLSLLPTLFLGFSVPPNSLGASNASYIRGIDVSHYQGSIDWHKVASSGIKFAMCKATEGTSYVDSTLSTNWVGMHAAGLIRGAYHFARPGSDAVQQAEHFVNAVNGAGGYKNSSTMQLVLDLEVTDGKSAAEVWAWTKAFLTKLEQLTGRPGIIYTGYYFWVDHVGAVTDNLNCPLWIASYTHPAPAGIPSPWAATGWAFWQYDDNGAHSPGGAAGSIPGISGNVDVDYFRSGGVYPSLRGLCFP